MQCDVCQTKEATIFLTQMIGGKMQKVNLCEVCSKEKGVDDPTGFALADLLKGLGSVQEMNDGAEPAKCGVCGFTEADFKKTGRMGCSACYSVFATGLSTLLKNMHKGTIHTGKTPVLFRKLRQQGNAMKQLQLSLGEAVAAEEYEKAASLRDQIRQIEAGVEK